MYLTFTDGKGGYQGKARVFTLPFSVCIGKNMLLRILIIIFITSVVMFLINFIFKRIFQSKKSTSLAFFKNCLVILCLAISIFSILTQFESTKEISKLLLQGSSLIIAISTFAAQKVLGNIISGFVLTTIKPFDINEKISLISTNGNIVVEGIVIDINLRHTTVKQVDGKCCMIPNGVLDEMIVVNNHTLENNGFPFPMWCTYDSDVELAMQLMKEEIENNPLTINKETAETNVLCAELGNNGFRLQAIIWTNNLNDNYKACSQLRISIYKRWKENGISIPYNTLTILEDGTKNGRSE